MTKLLNDPRIDPRIKAVFGELDASPGPNLSSREEVLAMMNSPQAQEGMAALEALFSSTVSEEAAPSAGIVFETKTFVSEPDGNTIQLQVIRPEGAGVLACVYYVHGGGMAFGSAYDDNYRAWGRIIAAQGVAVAMVDFRNCILPSSAPEVAPFPAGLNDCVSGLKWVRAHAAELKIDPDRIVVAGESGGGNLALATALKLNRDGEIGLIRGVYALCPFIAGQWPNPEYPSSIENEGVFMSLGHNRMTLGYGIEAFEQKNPLAWPIFATKEDLAGLPLTVISVNECDPLRDEGISFYRKLIAAGVPARCRVVVGATHAVEIFPRCAPDISANTANDIAYLARTGR
jgi:acetyl esterase/lipase